MGAELIIRPARHDDLPEVERICANTWDWGDYIPEVWDEWLQGEEGSLAVAEVGDRIVALGRVVVLPEGQAWLEGMRVDPDYRRRGIAWQFTVYKLDFARRHGARVARLGTGDYNEAVHAMMERAGMRRIGEYVHLSAEALPGDPPTIVAVEDAPRVRAFLKQSRALGAARGLYSTHWTWHELSDRQAERFVEAGQVAGRFAPDGSLAAMAVVEREPDGERVWIGFADVDPSAEVPEGIEANLPEGQEARRSALLTHFATDLRHYTAHAGVKSASIMVPRARWLRDAFAAAGYEATEWKGELWIYELDLTDVTFPGPPGDLSAAGGEAARESARVPAPARGGATAGLAPRQDVTTPPPGGEGLEGARDDDG